MAADPRLIGEARVRWQWHPVLRSRAIGNGLGVCHRVGWCIKYGMRAEGQEIIHTLFDNAFAPERTSATFVSTRHLTLIELPLLLIRTREQYEPSIVFVNECKV